MKILYIAELVGKAGVFAFKKVLPQLRSRYSPDFVVACADGVTGGAGLGRNHAGYLRKLGADVLTLGECAFYKKDLVEQMEYLGYVVRPVNLSAATPGWGTRIVSKGDKRLGVAVFLGQHSFNRLRADNPWALYPQVVERLKQETPHILIDFHAAASAEKQSMLHLADGTCSALIGSHGRIQTSDERITAKGTAWICDAGRTGSINSVGGSDAQTAIQRYISGIPDWTRDAWGECSVQGVYIEINEEGRAKDMERLCVSLPELAHE